jgi:anaerobic selenocysteine-containing dehydrogenase
MAELRKTTCNRDCPDTCGIVATVENGRVLRLQGDPEHPVTRGFLCYRTSHFLDTQYSPQRLQTPLLRRGDSFVPISWEEALDLAASRLTQIRAESGPASIFHYRSGGSLGLLTMLTDYFFSLFGPVTVKRGDICSGAGDAAQISDFGDEESSDFFDLLQAKNILIWGKNVYASNPHALPVLREAKEKGAGLVLIDPVWQRTASLCDTVYQPRPGGDFALAMGVARVLFANGWDSPRAAEQCDFLDEFRALALSRSLASWCEEAEVNPSAAHDLAARLHQGPTAILVGWGMGRRTNGGAIVRALDALSAISGNLGISGGGASFYYTRRRAFDCSFLQPTPPPRTLCEPLFGREVLEASDPPVRAVWITAGNPVAMLPESHTTARALSSRDFVVVVDSMMTDTARLAHLVLPTTTLLEDDNLLGSYGHHYLAVSRPVVAAPEGVKSDLDIMQGLSARVGLSAQLAGTPREWKRRFLRPEVAAQGASLEDLERGPVRNPLAQKVVYEGGRVRTENGRAQLIHQAPPAPEKAPREFPLFLMALSTDRSQSSQWAKTPSGAAELTVHPEAANGLPDGAPARVESALGSLEVIVRHDPKQRRDVALMAKGGHLSSGRCANAITQARVTDMGEGGALYEEPVRLVPR